LSLGRSFTCVSRAKTAEPIEMPFGCGLAGGSKELLIIWRPRSPTRTGNFEGQMAARCKVQGLSAVSCAKTAEPIEMQFEILSRACPGNQVLYGSGAHWRHLANTIKPPVCCGDAALCQITLTTCHCYYLLSTSSPRYISAVADP